MRKSFCLDSNISPNSWTLARGGGGSKSDRVLSLNKAALNREKQGAKGINNIWGQLGPMLTHQVLRKFFQNFLLKFKYVSSLGPYRKDQVTNFFF
jgi:hypothetical protein